VVRARREKDLFGNVNPLDLSTNVNFTTAFTPDSTAPQIVATNLRDGQTGVPTNAVVSVRFSEAINSLALAGVTLKQGGAVVSTQKQIVTDPFGSALKLIPTAPLPANTTYVFSVGGVSDLTGNFLPQTQSLTFTTGSAADVTRPSAIGFTPTKGATGLPRNIVLEVVFNEPVNPVTVTPVSFSLIKNGGLPPVVGTLTLEYGWQSGALHTGGRAGREHDLQPECVGECFCGRSGGQSYRQSIRQRQ